jgi:hypothetical protein
MWGPTKETENWEWKTQQISGRNGKENACYPATDQGKRSVARFVSAPGPRIPRLLAHHPFPRMAHERFAGPALLALNVRPDFLLSLCVTFCKDSWCFLL